MKKGLFLVFAILCSLTSWSHGSSTHLSSENGSSLPNSVENPVQIKLRSSDRAECVQKGFTTLSATFSFSTIESQDIATERGLFSAISMNNTIMGGNVGDPMIPVVNELIAVPFGASPSVTIKSYTTTDYKIEDYGIKRLFPRQPSQKKSVKSEDVVFVYNEESYQRRGLATAPKATVSVEGVMRGIRLGKLGIEPVSYDPTSNTLRVFNDIEVEVSFEGADAEATEDMLVKTYSPYFMGLYQQMFNGRAIMDAYTEHPDLYTTPPRMIVITTSTYSNNTKFQEWVNWKKQKGIYVDVYTTIDTGSSGTNIKIFLRNKYNAGVSAGQTPTFVVIVGDAADVAGSANSLVTEQITDLYYASVDNDIFPDMFESRMPVSSTAELTYLLNKILMYEQYTMPDPSYLGKALLVAGWDKTWTPKVGKPTVQYALNYYYNSEHGFSNIYNVITTGSKQNGQYDKLSSGVGFANYTAHGSEEGWYDPSFDVTKANQLTNTNKYFWAMGNCCLAANWGYNGTCLAEALLRGQDKGAFGYIGSCPETYWYEDYYFGVGATNITNQMPNQNQTHDGVYEGIWNDDAFNTLNAVPYFGNVSVTYAHANNYTSDVSDQYYWEAYHCLGDGSVMPYHVVPSTNTVSHNSILTLGVNTFTVTADAGSYVSLTKDNEIIGVALVGNTGTVDVPITPVTSPCDIKLVVTRQQRQPYIATVQVPSSTQYTINVNTDPSDGGTVTGAGQYYELLTATVTATPNLGYAFGGWKENNQVVSTDACYSFTVTGNRNLVAQFQSIPRNNISYLTCEHGSVSGPDQKYPTETVSLIATPEDGYGFASWNVYKTGHPGTTVTVTDNQFVMPNYDVTVSAVFGKAYDVSLASVLNGAIGTDKNVALSGEVVTLTATPSNDYHLSRWTVYKSDDVNTLIPVTDNHFTMPSYPVMVAASFSLSSSDEHIIGNGDGISDNIPTYTFYKYTLTQEIYTSQEIGNQGTIHSISFYYEGSSVRRNLDIYLSSTALQSFESTDQSNWQILNSNDKVFSGMVDLVSNGWTTITFDTPFVYHGSTNLLITIDDNTGDFTYNYGTFKTNATSVYSSLYYYNDGTNPNPLDFISVDASSRFQKNSYIKLGFLINVGTSISVGPSILNGFSYDEDYGPSEPQYFGIVATELSSNLTVTAPSHYEIGLQANGSYGNQVTLTPSNGEVRSMIYVRLKAGLEEGNYANETLTISDGMAMQTVSLSGAVSYSIPVVVSQDYTLTPGWSWWSSYLELDGAQALQDLEESLGSKASIIKSRDAFVTYDDDLGWLGSLSSLSVENMYKIKLNESCSFSLSDFKARPADHPITISQGWNWIGYMKDQSMSLTNALSSLTPSEGDIIKGYESFSMYYGGYGWWGTLSTLRPGTGYMYRSNSNSDLTLTYPAMTRNLVTLDNHEEQHHWEAVSGRYSDNLSLIVEVDGAHEGDEVGAFVDGECRGSAMLRFFEPTGQVLAFLTLYGEEDEVISLRCIENDEIEDINENVVFHHDLVMGSLDAPMTLTLKHSSLLNVFPNPIEAGHDLHIELPSILENQHATLEIMDVLGNNVQSQELLSNNLSINILNKQGIYFLRIITEDGEIYTGKVIIR